LTPFTGCSLFFSPRGIQVGLFPQPCIPFSLLRPLKGGAVFCRTPGFLLPDEEVFSFLFHFLLSLCSLRRVMKRFSFFSMRTWNLTSLSFLRPFLWTFQLIIILFFPLFFAVPGSSSSMYADLPFVHPTWLKSTCNFPPLSRTSPIHPPLFLRGMFPRGRGAVKPPLFSFFLFCTVVLLVVRVNLSLPWVFWLLLYAAESKFPSFLLERKKDPFPLSLLEDSFFSPRMRLVPPLSPSHQLEILSRAMHPTFFFIGGEQSFFSPLSKQTRSSCVSPPSNGCWTPWPSFFPPQPVLTAGAPSLCGPKPFLGPTRHARLSPSHKARDFSFFPFPRR